MLDNKQACLDHDGITIKINLVNLIEQRTVCKDTFTNIFSYQVQLPDTYVILIDKTDPRVPTKREDYWIHTLKTKAPIGLNVEGGYWALILYSY